MFALASILPAPVVSGLSSRLASSAQAEGNPWWLWIVVLLILAAFAACMLWWWLRSPEEEELPHTPARSEATGPGPAVSAEVASAPEREPEPEPAVVAEAQPSVDDLEIVEGIGPKIAAVLREAGITTFAQLASLEPERLRQILADRDPKLLRITDPATWPEQARLAAGGEWEALTRLQDELRGGRRA